MSDECTAHWQGSCRFLKHDSINVIKSEAELQGDWEALATSFPDEYSFTVDSLSQAWRVYWRETGVWDTLKAVVGDFRG